MVQWDADGKLTITPTEDLPPHVAQAIRKVRVRERVREDKNGGTVINRTYEFEMHPKDPALKRELERLELMESETRGGAGGTTVIVMAPHGGPPPGIIRPEYRERVQQHYAELASGRCLLDSADQRAETGDEDHRTSNH